MTIAKLFGSCNNINAATEIYIYTSEEKLANDFEYWHGLMHRFPDREMSLEVDVFRIHHTKNRCDIAIYPDWRRKY